MRNEVAPWVVYSVIGVVVLLLVGFFIRQLRTPKFVPDTTGSEAYQREYERTGRFYTPPPGVKLSR